MANEEEFQFSRCRCIWINGPVVVGAGLPGLAVASGLRKREVPFIMVEQANCIESLYDYLKLYLPKRFCKLPNFPFPDDFPEYPSKNEFISYLDSYATHFGIQPYFNNWVQSARFDDTSRMWRINTSSAENKLQVEYICNWVVVTAEEKILDKESDFLSKNGYLKAPFPNGWKGVDGLYVARFTKTGLSEDAIKVSEDIAKIWKDETKQKRLPRIRRRVSTLHF